MESFSNEDVATEILSRLPEKSLLAFKCTSNRWNNFISDPSFLRIYDKRSKFILGFFIQEAVTDSDRLDFELVSYVPFGSNMTKVQDTILNFLPEKVALMSSCNGLLCCRNLIYESYEEYLKHGLLRINRNKEIDYKKLVIYICNPATKEWISLRPEGCHVGEAFGLAYYPYGSSSGSGSSFKLVSIQHKEKDPGSYSFVIFSSETQMWKTSLEVCNFNSKLHPNREIFVNGRFHWPTWNHHIITFDAERELSQVIKLPGVTVKYLCLIGRCNCLRGLCLGESEGYLHCVSVRRYELKVWMLKEYKEPEWVLKFCLSLFEFYKEHRGLFPDLSIVKNYYEHPRSDSHGFDYLQLLAFHNEVSLFDVFGKICSYDFKSRKSAMHCGTDQLGADFGYNPTVLPYAASLPLLRKFKTDSVKLTGHPCGDYQPRTRRRKLKMFRT